MFLDDDNNTIENFVFFYSGTMKTNKISTLDDSSVRAKSGGGCPQGGLIATL